MDIGKLPQFHSKNGFIYVYNKAESKWFELRPVDILPIDVIDQVKELQEIAGKLKDSLKR